MDRKDLNEIIEQIVAEVVRRLKLLAVKAQKPEETVVLTVCAPAFPDCLRQYLDKELAGCYELVQLSDGVPWQDGPCKTLQELGETGVTERLYKAKNVILAAPSVELLRQLAAGDDTALAARMGIKAILWKKKVTLLLDYEPPKFHRNTFLGGISDALQTLRECGVTAENYCAALEHRESLLSLVTEQNVQRAAKTEERTVFCTQDAIITPAARDAAKELDVAIRYG